jgi:hypothetical protein
LPADAARTVDRAIAEALETSGANEAPGWRLLGSLQPEAPRGEGLLRAAGFVDEHVFVPPSTIADAFLWGRLESTGATLRLRFWLWAASGRVEPHVAEGDASELARCVRLALSCLPLRTSTSTDEATAAEERRALAVELVTEARTLAGTTHSAPGSISIVSLLLELAAFLEPGDREIQELRIIACLRDLPGDDFRRHSDPNLAEASRQQINLGLDYARLADRFWHLPDEHYDLRLLNASFIYSPSDTPGNRARAVRAAPIIARMSLVDLRPYEAMLARLLSYGETPDEDGFMLLEALLPIIARLMPDRLETPPNGGIVGVIPDLLEKYPDDQPTRSRLITLINHLPRGETATIPGTVSRHAPIVVQNSTSPVLPGSPPSPVRSFVP